jgi:hypothetical protein
MVGKFLNRQLPSGLDAALKRWLSFHQLLPEALAFMPHQQNHWSAWFLSQSEDNRLKQVSDSPSKRSKMTG